MTPINILHLSDLHLSHKELANQKLVLKAFFADLTLQADGPLAPDFVIFSGDLVNDPDLDNIYSVFRDEVFQKIKDITRLADNCFFFCAGNHDTSRRITEPIVEPLREARGRINSLADAESEFNRPLIQDFVALRYKEFDKFVRSLQYPDVDLILPTHSVFRRPAQKLVFVGANSCVFSLAGLVEKDLGKLSISDTAINSWIDGEDNNSTVIYFQHHPNNWMNEVFNTDTSITLSKTKLHLFGHVHAARPTQTISPTGTSIQVQGGALFTDRERLNSYSIISLSPDHAHTAVHYRTYMKDRRQFDTGVNVASNGVFYPTEQDREYWSQNISKTGSAVSPTKFMSWLTTSALPALRPELNNSIADLPLEKVFVAPELEVLTSNKEAGLTEVKQPVSAKMDELIRSNDNCIVTFSKDFGQTSFAKQFALKTLNMVQELEHPRLPLIIDVSSHELYENAIIKALKQAYPDWHKAPQSVDALLQEGRILVIFENIDPTNEEASRRISKFAKKYALNRYVFCTYGIESELLQMVEFHELPNLARYSALPLKRNQVREMTASWPLPDALEEEWVVNHVCETIRRLGIPRSPVNVSILLTILQAHKTVSPTNVSTLVENYVEITLDKHDPKNAFRREFDYKNKIDYLSYIAKCMYDLGVFRLEYADLLKATETYFTSIGIRQNYPAIINYFLASKIFVREANTLSFRLDMLQTFFAANRMLNDDVFKNKLLADVVRYSREVGFYCDLRRASSDVLEIAYSEFKKADDILVEIFNFPVDEAYAEHFSWQDSDLLDSIPKKIQEKVAKPRPSSKERDELIEPSHDKSEGLMQDLNRDENQDVILRWFSALVLYSNCLRNLDEIPVDLKLKHAKEVLHGWAKAAMYAMKIMEMMSQEGAFNFKGVTFRLKNDGGPVTDVVMLNFMSLIVGSIAIEFAKNELGTPKLEVILGDDKVYSGLLSRLIGKSIYLGMKMREFLSTIEPLYKLIRKSKYLSTLFHAQMYTFYLSSPLSSIEENVFRKKMAALFADAAKPDSQFLRDKLFDEKLKVLKSKPSGTED